MVSRVIPVEEFDLVIFGGTGDLARRKILPGLFRRFLSGQMPDGARIIGAARSDIDSDGYRQMIREANRLHRTVLGPVVLHPCGRQGRWRLE
jgi:glucose-6-phosphate 1-dehydrogenase